MSIYAFWKFQLLNKRYTKKTQANDGSRMFIYIRARVLRV